MSQPTIIILLGPPGAGKGTQAGLLARRHRFAHISTGDLLREEVRKGTRVGRKVGEIMEAGELVPDELVGDMVRKRIVSGDGEKGYILDGFPRNLAQARYLERVLQHVTVVAVNMDVDEEQLVRRLSGRRYCPNCGKIYNLHLSSQEGESCSACGAELRQRPDDSEEVIAERLRVYREQTEPVIEFYASRRNYFSVDGNRGVEEVAGDLSTIVNQMVRENSSAEAPLRSR